MSEFFAQDPTEEEIARLFGDLSPEEFERLKEEIQKNAGSDFEHGLIYDLYMLRGDEKKARKWLSRIKDPLYRLSKELIWHECIPPEAEGTPPQGS